LWAGLTSDYFSVLSGVKQGGVISPILFCIYIDDLLLRLSLAGAGCYIGFNFVGACAYADDITLLAPSPTAMRILLASCDEYASEYDIVFNAEKSKFLVMATRSGRMCYNYMASCAFYIGGDRIQNVSQFTHLGHIITSSFQDCEDIKSRRNGFVSQVNSLLCFFAKLDILVKLRLFKSYCSSLYGCELWSLNDAAVEDFCIAWRKALRRICNLHYKAHSYLLPIISDTLPICDELYKRSVRFITSCLLSPNYLVRFVSWHSVVFSKFDSPLGSNAWFCSRRYNFDINSLVLNLSDIQNNFFKLWYQASVTNTELSDARCLLELLLIRSGYMSLPDEFTKSDIDAYITAITTT
jgi:hypothetical protein